ncbi:iron-sulfur cluster assembly protein [Chloropicon roscoffensis]|uniref:Iron-sulfur cluster assembly protein n=1 Tax=Chloropicon roscoffensis TaxID=1461544 RepID=A0AAX4PJS2_9CHLO
MEGTTRAQATTQGGRFAGPCRAVARGNRATLRPRAARFARVAPLARPSWNPKTSKHGARASTKGKAQAEEQEGSKLAPCITLTDKALSHLNQLKQQKTVSDGVDQLLLRIGVKQGGCSGMSYFMDFETPQQVVDDDAVMDLEGDMKLVCDPKSLLYLFGMVLDYSDELIGGGFKFSNPNADSTCGCGKSFSV